MDNSAFAFAAFFGKPIAARSQSFVISVIDPNRSDTRRTDKSSLSRVGFFLSVVVVNVLVLDVVLTDSTIYRYDIGSKVYIAVVAGFVVRFVVFHIGYKGISGCSSLGLVVRKACECKS